MLAITIVLFVVPHNQQIVTIRQFFTYCISLFRNQNLNIEQKPSQDISSGYTEIELAKAIRDKKQELKTLDLDLRKAKLSLSENKALLNDGIVRAKRSGIVRNIKDLSNPIQDGSAFLEVATGQGTYIKGSISELMLNQIKVGDTISAYCWTSGETFDAKIQSIDTVPSVSYTHLRAHET